MVAQHEAEFNYLLGPAGAHLQVGGDLTVDHSSKEPIATQSPHLSDEAATKLLEALNRKVSVDLDAPLPEVLVDVEKRYGHGIAFVLTPAAPLQNWHAEGKKHTLNATKVVDIPMGALIQLLTDLKPGLAFVARDYGILVTDADSVPPGAQTVHDFWLARQAKK
jgi:hypothetical protein